MKLSVLIAEPSDILRIGLRTILAADEHVTTLLEASSTEALQKYLRNGSIDLVIVNQSLVSDITILPANHFVLLTSEFDIATFLSPSRTLSFVPRTPGSAKRNTAHPAIGGRIWQNCLLGIKACLDREGDAWVLALYYASGMSEPANPGPVTDGWRVDQCGTTLRPADQRPWAVS